MMKKLKQWRVTVPTINPGGLFKTTSSTSKSPSTTPTRHSTGSYDLEEAQKKYDEFRIISGEDSRFSSSSSSSDDLFEDAQASNPKCSSTMSDTELYVDVANEKEKSKKQGKNNSEEEILDRTITSVNQQQEYDVPKIKFSFFGQSPKEISAIQNEESTDHLEAIYQNEEAEEPSRKMLIKSEISITLSQPLLDEYRTSTSLEILPVVGVIRSGSDPNLTLSRLNQGGGVSLEDFDDNFYKIPRQLVLTKRNRLSQSLSDFNAEEFKHEMGSKNSSIEHISCSQVLLVKPVVRQGQEMQMHQHKLNQLHQDSTESNQSENLDYCKVRSRLPLKIRRPTFLRKPKNVLDSWNNFRSKINNMMTEQASQQRVGAYEDKEKLTINLEEMYKNSKTKCKKALKMFNKKVNSQGSISSSNSKDEINECSDQRHNSIVKNDAFFARVPLTADDIEYKFTYENENNISDKNMCESNGVVAIPSVLVHSVSSQDNSANSEENGNKEFDFSSFRSAFRRSKYVAEGQNGFEDLRRYVKQGGDFCKELAAILQERADTETQYAKNLSKLSSKLARACRENVGGLNEAWKSVALEMEARAEAHRIMGAQLLDDTAKPLRLLSDNHHKTRKQCESAVDKTAKSLADWRIAEAKGKKQSHTCARDNEKLQDAALLDHSKSGKLTLSRSTSLIQITHNHSKSNSDKESAKLEGKKRKAEDAVKKADIEYYTLCVRAEKARLEWESAVLRGVNTFQSLEEERLNNLKTVLNAYLQHGAELAPRLLEATESLKFPVQEAEPSRDLCTFVNLRQTSQQVSEQLLPDFYCEHITLAMNRERRKQALVKLLHLIRQDIERERKSKNGLENLSKAIKQTPNFGAEDSQQNVSEKLYHMKSMLTYLEGARYKVYNALAELDSRPKSGHPLAAHITITRDKSGLQQSILKVPQWLREEWFESSNKSPVSEKSVRSDQSDNSDPHNNDLAEPDWTDRGAADGNSNQPDSDFDEFSSQCSSVGNPRCQTEEIPVQPIAHCKALYPYTPNLTDELALHPGDLLSVYRQQDDGWWLGECRGNVGIFPATYVEVINTN